ncbi:very-long-chain 3-oxoacyl-CoA reductase-like isoform X2 [Topomyia yanbarensis]|uniref:very-long-chain 3-oxoacyl-CoA reductase-like isoform X2 n=1 Tax=Topomyia yanbarensis TaxID=2498891 RepID=UPI00273C8919|nr:very-long-chain 3-oxoacyl-CoA reductase-like isoform X2 [Topomyia yanbarensis]
MFEAGSVLGSFVMLVGVYASVQYLFDNLYSPFEIIWNVLFGKREPFYERYGKWAVITGSSDGIGKEYAMNLARKGMNIMLISRTDAKLVQVAKDIKSKYKVEVKWIAVDFSASAQVYEKIQQELAEIEIGMLVNNVGMAHEHPLSLEQLSKRDIEQSITVNIFPTVMLTYMILPQMKLRHRGIVVNISSSSGHLPLPYLQMYSASKSFVNSLTLSLQQELRGTGVECQLVSPMFVNTNMTEKWQSMGFWKLVTSDVERYARMAVWTIGKTEVTTGYWYHALQL